MKFVSIEAQNSHIIAAILSSTQQPGGIFVTSFCPRDFVHGFQQPLTTTLGMSAIELYYFKPRVSVQFRPRFCVIYAEYSILTQNEMIVGSY